MGCFEVGTLSPGLTPLGAFLGGRMSYFTLGSVVLILEPPAILGCLRDCVFRRLVVSLIRIAFHSLKLCSNLGRESVEVQST